MKSSNKDEIFRYMHSIETSGEGSMVNMASRVRGRFQLKAREANKWVLLWAKERKDWLLNSDNQAGQYD